MNLLSLIIKLGVDKADYDAKMAGAERTAGTTADRMVNKFKKKFAEGMAIGVLGLFTRQSMETAKDWATIGKNAERLGLVFDNETMNRLGEITRQWEALALQMQLTFAGPLTSLMKGLATLADGLAEAFTVLGAISVGSSKKKSMSEDDILKFWMNLNNNVGAAIVGGAFNSLTGKSSGLDAALKEFQKRMDDRNSEIRRLQMGGMPWGIGGVSGVAPTLSATRQSGFARQQIDSLAKIGGFSQVAGADADIPRKQLDRLEKIVKNTDGLNTPL